MNLSLFVGVVCAVFFFRAADYERMNPWTWSLSSVGLTAIAALLGSRVGLMLLVQAGLFGVMWWLHARRLKHMTRQYTGG